MLISEIKGNGIYQPMINYRKEYESYVKLMYILSVGRDATDMTCEYITDVKSRLKLKEALIKERLCVIMLKVGMGSFDVSCIDWFYDQRNKKDDWGYISFEGLITVSLNNNDNTVEIPLPFLWDADFSDKKEIDYMELYNEYKGFIDTTEKGNVINYKRYQEVRGIIKGRVLNILEVLGYPKSIDVISVLLGERKIFYNGYMYDESLSLGLEDTHINDTVSGNAVIPSCLLWDNVSLNKHKREWK